MIKKILEGFSKSEKISFLITLGFCIIFVIVSIFVPIKKKEKYEPIQISLSSSGSDFGNKDIKSKTASESKKEVVKQESSKQEVVKQEVVKQESSKQEVVKQEVKTATTKTNSTPAKTSSSTKQKAAKVREEKIYESVESLMAKQNSVKKEVEWDESLFAEDSFFSETSSSSNATTSSSTATNSSTQIIDNPFSGSAAIITEETNSIAATTSSSTVNNVAQDYFENTASDNFSEDNVDLGVMASDAESFQSINGVAISWGTDKSRKIISPKNPQLVISEKNQRLITSSKNLVLSFTVLANGNVTMSSFQVKPAGVLPKVIEDELRSQVLSWRFEARDSSSKAQLNYRIEVK